MRNAAFCLLLCGCVTSTGALDRQGFVHQNYPYRIGWSDPDTEQFIDGDWRIDNFYIKSGEWVQKEAPEYTHEVDFDLDGDGEPDRSDTMPIYDLYLEHRETDQAIWIRTLILSRSDAKKHLDVISRRYIEGIAGAGYSLVTLHDGKVEIAEKRFATKMLGEAEVAVGDYAAYITALDVANVDQVSLDQTARQRRVLLVFVRTGYEHKVEQRGNSHEFPTVFVAGYAAFPEDFNSGLSAFRQLLSRVKLYRQPEGHRMQDPTAMRLDEGIFDFARVGAAPADPSAVAGEPRHDATAASAPEESPDGETTVGGAEPPGGDVGGAAEPSGDEAGAAEETDLSEDVQP